ARSSIRRVRRSRVLSRGSGSPASPRSAPARASRSSSRPTTPPPRGGGSRTCASACSRTPWSRTTRSRSRGMGDEMRRRGVSRQQLRSRRLPRLQARARRGDRLPLARRRDDRGVRPGGAPRRLRLRRLPAGRRPRRSLAGDDRGETPRGGGRARTRHLQRLSGPARSGSPAGRDAAQRRPPLPLPGRLPAGRARRPAVHLGAREGPGPPPADRPCRGQLRGRPRGARRARSCRAGRLPLRQARRRGRPRRSRGSGCRAMESERRGPRDRRHLQPGGQRARPDAPSRALGRRAARQHGRPGDALGPGDRRGRAGRRGGDWECGRRGGRRARGGGALTDAPEPTVDLELAREQGLSAEEYETLRRILGRDPSWTELGVTSALWSEHCSYKSSKVYLREFPTAGARVLQGPGENAGVVDIGHGLVAVFKMESHNHPSYIEPYQGAATGMGGILRDVFTMGARPIACLDALRFGALDAPRMRSLVDGVVRGIGDYGNCVGIPTVGGETAFHPSYNGNILVNAFALGVAKKDEIFLARASGAGNPVLYAGSRTGRDGIHGATMASESFDAESEKKRPTVQVGDPFTEKILLEACLDVMRTGAVVAIQDMGAAGLTSSTFEMAGRGGTGLKLELDRVPLREPGLTPYEMMLSESQERMVVVAARGREEEVERVFRRWGLEVEVIGEITDTGRAELSYGGQTYADIPIAPLTEGAPVYRRKVQEPADLAARWAAPDVPEIGHPLEALERLLDTPDFGSKLWIWRQYDHTVRTNTIRGPGGDAAVVRLKGTPSALALT